MSDALPKPLTSFIGRQPELAQAKRLLRENFLVTLTGPGGTGKTRLCIALAGQVAADYPDGVYFVPLAPIRDPGLVPSTIAQGIGLQDPRDRPLMEHLVSQLRTRRLLLVLDNFEHLLAGAPVVAQLLQGTSAVRILVSSRSSLRVSGEQECPVPPLAVPDPRTEPTPQSVAGCDSVRLFAERAAAAVPGFTIDGQNAPAIAQIVRRLDGLPLAIELAAARVKVLPPEAIQPRLEHSLTLLTGGCRDLPTRLQTLRATIAWSYDLLTEGAERLLAACSVFAGGASLEVIERVCGAALDAGLPVLDGLAELVGQSLLRQLPPRPGATSARYAMLETIREYAAERLAQLPEADRVRSAHAGAFLALVESAGRPHAGLARQDWLERVGTEHNNIRAALSWYRTHDPSAALRMAASMAAFWSLRGHHTEGRQRLREVLGRDRTASVARVSALNGAAWLAIDQGDYSQATGLLAESIGLSQALHDPLGEGIATAYLGRCKMSRLQMAEGVPDVERAAALLASTGDRPAIAFSQLYSGLAAQFTGRLAAACDYFARCADMSAELGLEPLQARAKQVLGCALVDLGELAAARAALEEGLPASIAVGDRWVVTIGLAGFAGHAAKTGRPRLAFRLWGRGRGVPGRQHVHHARADPGAGRPVAGPGPPQRRAGRRPDDRGRPTAQPGGGGRPRPGQRAGGRPVAGSGAAAGSWATVGSWAAADPARDRGRPASGLRADQPGRRRATVPVGPHSRGARGPHPDQAGLPHPHPAGRLGLRGRPAAWPASGARTARTARTARR